MSSERNDLVSAVVSRSGEAFDAMVAALQAHFTATLATSGRLFQVTTPDLAGVYLDAFPEADRQYHTCSACRHFLRRYGALATVSEDGELVPAVWTEDVPDPYRAATASLAKAIRRGRISGVAIFSEPVWGTPETGEWTHFAIRPPAELLYRGGLLTAGQQAAAKREDYVTLQRALAEFSRAAVEQAVTLLEAEALYRAEKILGPARFLLTLHDVRDRLHGQQRENAIWHAVAGAPAGWCQPRSAMIGTLLEDITAGYDFATVKRRFDAKMHPLQYQRPQAAPAAGNIQQAEKIVAQLGIESALRRRFARLDEIETIWRPVAKAEPEPSGGVFGHLHAKGTATVQPLAMPAQTVTWVKFARDVLPKAVEVEVYCTGRMNLCGLVTAVDPDAKPILQWDRDDRRNPVSWYVYNGGSTPEQWGLASGRWAPVTAVTLQPSLWGDTPQAHQGQSAIFVIDGARDSHESGLALFPETLRSELHAIRSTIEAYARSRQIEGREEASANGLRVGDGRSQNQIRVTTATGTAVYSIDRWE